jgi:mono/diheme cytochrome c family protein
MAWHTACLEEATSLAINVATFVRFRMPVSVTRVSTLACGYFLIVVLLSTGCRQREEIIFPARAEAAKLTSPMQQVLAHKLTELTGTPAQPKLLSDPNFSTARLLAGQAAFQQRCAACHGDSGNGAGPAAVALNPKPRDYRKGIFKFISTIDLDNPSGNRKKKPTHADLTEVIRRGAIGTSMPAFPLLTEQEVEDLITYVRYLAQRGELEYRILTLFEAEEDVFEDLPAADGGDPNADEKVRKVRFVEDVVEQQVAAIAADWNKADDFVMPPLTTEPKFSLESVARGRDAFLGNVGNCYGCHGRDGRGMDIPPEQAQSFQDSWGNLSRAADLSAGMFHGGGRSIDIYRRIMIGIEPMPSRYADLSKNPELVWDLVHYVQYIASARRRENAADSVFAIEKNKPAAASDASE